MFSDRELANMFMVLGFHPWDFKKNKTLGLDVTMKSAPSKRKLAELLIP